MASEETTPKELSVGSSQNLATSARYFALGTLLSGVPVLAYLWLSVDMTYGSWSAVGAGRLSGAIAVPLVCGLLTARWGQRAVRILSGILESTHLPF